MPVFKPPLRKDEVQITGFHILSTCWCDMWGRKFKFYVKSKFCISCISGAALLK